MVKQHVQRTYRDGPDGNTPIVSSGLNDDQDTLAKLSIAVGDLEAGNGGGATGTPIVSFGDSTQRGTPTVGRIHLNTDTHKPEFAWGDSWRDATGTVVSAGGGTGGTGGSSNAPQNAVAVVNPDNSIDVSASPVTAGTTRTYNLYELRQAPALVTGLSTPSSHRTPGGTGTYGYWWTATVDGVESAASNIAYCALPYGSSVDGSGGSTGGGAIDTPSEILRLGDEGGHWSLDIGVAGGSNTSISMSTVENGYSNTPYFIPVESNSGVQFRVPMNGGTTPNSSYPRVELRERTSTGATASWNPKSGTHQLSGVTKVTHFPPNKPEVVVAQIHDSSDDRLQLRVHNDEWYLSINGSIQSSPILTGYSLNTYVSWSVKVASGKVTVSLNGVTKYNATPSGWPTSGAYFKVGNYAQTNVSKGNSSSEYLGLTMQLNSLLLSHS